MTVSSVTAVALGAVLAAFLLVLAALMVWQEGRRGRGAGSDPIEYVLDDAVAWTIDRIDAATRARLARHDVLRILEWQVFYLQQSVRGARRGQAEVVVGDTAPAVEYIVTRAADTQGVHYRPDDVAEVLSQQGSYLESLGAIAEPVREV